MNNIIKTVGKDGRAREFEIANLTDDDEGIYIQVKPVGVTPLEYFDFKIERIDSGTGQVTMMDNHGNTLYTRTGLPEAMIQFANKELRLQIMSSPTWGTAGVFRTPLATKVWLRLMEQQLAEYDTANDVFI